MSGPPTKYRTQITESGMLYLATHTLSIERSAPGQALGFPTDRVGRPVAIGRQQGPPAPSGRGRPELHFGRPQNSGGNPTRTTMDPSGDANNDTAGEFCVAHVLPFEGSAER